MTTWRILQGDVRETLASLPASSVQTCVTSPPYWGLRDYGHAGQLGLEPTPDVYVAAMVEVFGAVWRVLRDDGTLWLNLGDSYAAAPVGSFNGGGFKDASAVSGGRDMSGVAQSGRLDKAKASGCKPKDLVGIPWMVAFALRSAGWYLRSDIIWAKPNPMPESVQDRPTKAHEYLFLFAKSERYFYDAAAIAEDAVGEPGGNVKPTKGADDPRMRTRAGIHEYQQRARDAGRIEKRNRRTVWTVPTQPYHGAHFATFPEALIEPCILAGSREGDTVLDPFTGSGTTGAVAIRHQRSFVGCELNPNYIELARKRIGDVAPMFSQEVA